MEVLLLPVKVALMLAQVRYPLRLWAPTLYALCLPNMKRLIF